MSEPSAGERDEAPPPGGSWGYLYALVLLDLAAVIALCAWISRFGR